MRWTRWAVAVAGLALLPGCVAWMQSRHLAVARFDSGGRPVSSYYCYDCHGYRYLDPYYDWCAGYGFRYEWDRHPEAVRVYRERYVRIKEENPTFGRYRYPARYRDVQRYREPKDYEQWRSGARPTKPQEPGDLKVREKVRHEPGNTKKDSRKDRKDSERRRGDEPREARPTGERRSGSFGGE